MRGSIRPASKKIRDKVSGQKNYRKADIDKWEIRYPLGKVDGKYKSDSETVEGTWDEAKARLREILSAIDDGTYIKPTKMTVETYINKWLKEYVKPNLKLKTYRSYKQNSQLYIIPYLGNHKLSRLTPFHIQKFYNTVVAKTGISYTSLGILHRTLKAALGKAVEWKFIKENPAKSVTPPGPDEREYNTLSTEQALKLLETAQQINKRRYALYLCLLTTGMRIGEACALKWEDIDFAQKIIRVQRNLVRAGENYEFGTVKQNKKKGNTKKVKVAIRMTDILADALRREQEWQKEDKEKVFNPRRKRQGYYNDLGMVFPTRSGLPLDPTNISSREFKNVLAKAGLPDMRLHDLRHSTANLLLDMGVPIEVISQILRHSSITITENTYLHPDVSLQDDAMEKINQAFSKK